jgi:hypothetical protein
MTRSRTQEQVDALRETQLRQSRERAEGWALVAFVMSACALAIAIVALVVAM